MRDLSPRLRRNDRRRLQPVPTPCGWPGGTPRRGRSHGRRHFHSGRFGSVGSFVATATTAGRSAGVASRPDQIESSDTGWMRRDVAGVRARHDLDSHEIGGQIFDAVTAWARVRSSARHARTPARNRLPRLDATAAASLPGVQPPSRPALAALAEFSKRIATVAPTQPTRSAATITA